MGSSFIDITGQTFYELTALEYLGDRMWKFRCSCGKECIARKNDVTTGRKKSCGHLAGRNQEETLKVGDKFNDWTIIDILSRREIKCRCSCGKERTVTRYDLMNNKTKSCGHESKGTGDNGRKDMTGQRIGEWSIGEYLGDGKYLCTCSCGEQRELRGTYLRTGQSMSCGHATNAFKDLTNQQFNDWTAIRYLGDNTWECRCSCGTIGKVGVHDLLHNKSTNCGCKRKQDLYGKRFGRLIANRYLGNQLWECECDCGSIVNIRTNNLTNGSTISCGCDRHIKKQELLSKIEYAIAEFITQTGQQPFASDIAEILGITDVTVTKYAKEFDFLDKLNKHFGSKAERDIYNFITELIPDETILLHDKTILQGKELDIYIPSRKLAIEFNGTYWHCTEQIHDKFYHQHKTIECAKQGIRLIHIFEYEWQDLEKQLRLQNFIKGLLDSNKHRINGRDTTIKEIGASEARAFINKYHLQGNIHSKIRLGCFYNDELVGVMTLGSSRFNNNYQYEIHRLCWKSDVQVIGGSEKLFKYFLNNYNPDSVISYCDISKFTGNVYFKLGMKSIQPNPISEPNYVWISTLNNNVVKRYESQKHKLISQGLGTLEQTEDEIMASNGYLKVYDCGNLRVHYIKQ